MGDDLLDYTMAGTSTPLIQSEKGKESLLRM